MSDLIHLVDLEVWSRLGVPDDERAQPQRLLVTAEMRINGFERAAATDDIAYSVNYFDVAQYIKNFANERPRKLLETFAEDLASALLGAFAIKRLRLEIKKFVVPNTRHVSVEIERKGKKSKKPETKAPAEIPAVPTPPASF